MQIDVGDYTLDCDIDPTVQNNAEGELIPIDSIGFIYNCVFKQKKAFEYSVEAIRRVYRDAKIYVVSDGGLDYSYMEDENLKFSMEEDTVSPAKDINGDNFEKPEFEGYYDIDIKLFSNLTQKEFVYVLKNRNKEQIIDLNNESR